MYKWQTQAIADLDILVSVDSIAPYLDSIFFFLQPQMSKKVTCRYKNDPLWTAAEIVPVKLGMLGKHGNMSVWAISLRCDLSALNCQI